TFYTNIPNDILISATAISTYTNVDHVDFFADGAWVGNDNTPDTNTFYYDWSPPGPGPHVLSAVATDAALLIGKSLPVIIDIADTNNTVTAVDDKLVVMADAPPTTLDVLANDSTSSGHPLRILELYPVQASVGTAEISF